jgi:dTDP-4-dehydrorhamnose reductase
VINLLVTGRRGQVGSAVADELMGRVKLIGYERGSLDLADPDAIRQRIRHARPDVIVNAGAYTAVDQAESDESVAHAVNAVAPGVLGEEAKRANALLIHFSTDYVFDGSKRTPYVEEDAVNPVSAYGRTKLAGERAVAASGCRHLTLRTSWVYGPQGKNFMLTMLRLAETRDELRVVNDQRGAPTSSRALARLVRALLDRGDAGELARAQVDRLAEASGLYHATAGGETTWFGFAQAIFESAAKRNASLKVPRVVPIATREYPTPAKRPAYSVLSNARLASKLGTAIPDWHEGLEDTTAVLFSGR